MMTDRSLPVGDRDEPPAVTGPAMARQALGDAAPTPDSFTDRVVRLAHEQGWTVIRPGPHSDPGCPDLLLFNSGRVVAAWITPAPSIGWQGSEHKAHLSRAGVATFVFRPRDGMDEVADVLRTIEPDCGQPRGLHDVDAGRRGD